MPIPDHHRLSDDAQAPLQSSKSSLDSSEAPALTSVEAWKHIRRLEDEVRTLQEAVPKPLWKIRDVAQYLNVSKRTVENILADGELVPIRIRSARRFQPEAVKAYARRCAER